MLSVETKGRRPHHAASTAGICEAPSATLTWTRHRIQESDRPVPQLQKMVDRFAQTAPPSGLQGIDKAVWNGSPDQKNRAKCARQLVEPLNMRAHAATWHTTAGQPPDASCKCCCRKTCRVRAVSQSNIVRKRVSSLLGLGRATTCPDLGIISSIPRAWAAWPRAACRRGPPRDGRTG